jgi:transposase-like protein
VGLGITEEDGQKVLWDWELFHSESGSCGEGFLEGLISRGHKPPCIGIIDGNKGLRAALEKNWRGPAVQRCTVHKRGNLEG